MKEKITLNNNVDWTKEILLERMLDDEFYYGYCGQNMLSSSEIKLLHKGLKSYWYIKNSKQESSQALRDGWLFHCSILEPEKYDKQIFVDTLTKGTAFKQAELRHGIGKVFTKKERLDTERLQDAYFKNERAKTRLINCKTEVPVAGMIDDLAFRAKADIITPKGKIVDLKTTRSLKGLNAEQKVNKFRHDAYSLGYDTQVYIYCNLFGITYKDFEFVAIDKDSLEIGIFNATLDFYNSGKRKVLEATKIYKECFYQKDKEEILDIINSYIIEGNL